MRSTGFAAAPGSHCLLPGDSGLAGVLLGIGGEPMGDWASLPDKLPPATYRIEPLPSADEADAAALGWALATYRFEHYRDARSSFATLAWPASQWAEMQRMAFGRGSFAPRPTMKFRAGISSKGRVGLPWETKTTGMVEESAAKILTSST